MKIYKVKSPAKINIGLRVLSKRKDGYHNIETIFYPIKLYDNVSVSITPSKISKLSVKTLIKNKKLKLDDKNNICYKTVILFLECFRIKSNYNIKIIIRKNIPVGAGLGGGSSNAASVLKVLAKHFKKSKYKSTLQKLALELGSDVPFFLNGKPAYASGRGEKLVPLPKFKVNYRIQIIYPGIHISTAWAYNQLKVKNYKFKIFNKIIKFNPADKRLQINDFEKVVFKKYPLIGKLNQKMYENGAVFACMSGSGSAIYGFFKNKKTAV